MNKSKLMSTINFYQLTIIKHQMASCSAEENHWQNI